MASKRKSRKGKKNAQPVESNPEIIRETTEKFSSKRSESEIWTCLRILLDHHAPNLSESLVLQIRDVIEHRSIENLMRLQEYGDPRSYGSPAEYFAATSVTSFLKKYPFGKVAGLDPEQAASDSTIRAEKLCRITNRRLRFFEHRGLRLERKCPGMFDILNLARSYICNWLGALDLNEVYRHCGHGPGGVIGVSGDATTAYYKFAASEYTVTPGARSLAKAAILADEPWRASIVNPERLLGDPIPSVKDSLKAVHTRLRTVEYNKVTFVPKTAKTHRSIAIEPLMNIYLQLGFGRVIQRKLSSAGCDLSSQTRNQKFARRGSRDWLCADSLATIDLSMASDTLSYELVRLLLPADWFDMLCLLRSPYGELQDGTLVHWAKFSSMGNGFTFPLESMIFYALSLAVAKRCGITKDRIAVYGDDIIVPRGMALWLKEVLHYCGFTFNTEKSFISGPFRESCGTDWFEGSDVRPIHLTRRVETCRDLIFLINRFGGLTASGGDFHPLASALFRRLPSLIRNNLLGPPCEDLEGHVHVSWDLGQKSPLVTWHVDYQSWQYTSVVPTPIGFGGKLSWRLLQALSILGDDEYGYHLSTLTVKSGYFEGSLFWVAPPKWVERFVKEPVKGLGVKRRNAVRYKSTTPIVHHWGR